MLASVLIHFLLVLAGSGIPMAIQLMSVELRYVDYSYLQITNPFWSLIHVADGGMPTEATCWSSSCRRRPFACCC